MANLLRGSLFQLGKGCLASSKLIKSSFFVPQVLRNNTLSTATKLIKNDITPTMQLKKRTFGSLFTAFRQSHSFSNSSLQRRGGAVVDQSTREFWKKIRIAAGLGFTLIVATNLMSSYTNTSVNNGFSPLVHDRLFKTFGYVAASVVGTAAVANYIFVRPVIAEKIMNVNPFVAGIGMIAASMGFYYLMRNSPNPLIQHIALAGFAAMNGAVLFPVCAVAGEILFQAALGTGGILGAMAVAAMTAPSDTYLNMSGPLMIGMGIVFAASFSQILFPTSSLLYGVSLYGGLALFSAFMFFDTQKTVSRAKYQINFNPIAEAAHIYMDCLNVFIRLVTILSNNGQNKRR